MKRKFQNRYIRNIFPQCVCDIIFGREKDFDSYMNALCGLPASKTLTRSVKILSRRLYGRARFFISTTTTQGAPTHQFITLRKLTSTLHRIYSRKPNHPRIFPALRNAYRALCLPVSSQFTCSFTYITKYKS